jgi:hypothetical protein
MLCILVSCWFFLHIVFKYKLIWRHSVTPLFDNYTFDYAIKS